ncbi:uncharacterized protein METZ01_LOCUS31932 [marine metagenome]|uniref:Uncharacterized protein n=1 Tax=marine metagenome TaxID=408172 RepID=A0A381QJH7_9ZZZZ
MSHRSDPELLVALALRLKGFGEVDSIASVHGLAADMTGVILSHMAAAEKCVMRQVEGVEKYVLTPTGREEGQAALGQEMQIVEAREVVRGAYDNFLQLNPEMLQLCTDWQVRDDHSGEQKLNDHSDSEYDRKILDRLVTLDKQIADILRPLIDLLSRFDNYPSRFTLALEKVLAGDLDWLTKPIMASYHTVWFELHEDLLATLGIDRASEASV